MTSTTDAQYTDLDLDDLQQVVQELRNIAASRDEFGSLDSPHRSERLAALARITMWAGRATWLELAEAAQWRREEMAHLRDKGSVL